MTTPDMPTLATTGSRKKTKADLRQFRIDDVTYTLRRPKQAILAGAASVLERPETDSPKRLGQLLGFVGQLIQYVEHEPPDKDGNLLGRALLEERLSDPDDDLDLEELVPLLTKVLEGWFGRPTGSPRVSTPRRRTASSGRASRARTR